MNLPEFSSVYSSLTADSKFASAANAAQTGDLDAFRTVVDRLETDKGFSSALAQVAGTASASFLLEHASEAIASVTSVAAALSSLTSPSSEASESAQSSGDANAALGAYGGDALAAWGLAGLVGFAGVLLGAVGVL